MSAAQASNQTASVAHAESVWRTLSEAIDAVPAPEHTAFLTRLAMLTALDHLTIEQLDHLMGEARAAG